MIPISPSDLVLFITSKNILIRYIDEFPKLPVGKGIIKGVFQEMNFE